MCVRGTTTPDQLKAGPSSVSRLRSPRFSDHPIRSLHNIRGRLYELASERKANLLS
jgi:hypothetical protein